MVRRLSCTRWVSRAFTWETQPEGYSWWQLIAKTALQAFGHKAYGKHEAILAIASHPEARMQWAAYRLAGAEKSPANCRKFLEHMLAGEARALVEATLEES